MEQELEELVTDLHKIMHRAMNHAWEADLENNFDGDIDDYDGLDDDALAAFIEDLSDDLSSFHCPSSDNFTELQVLTATKNFFLERGDAEDCWEITAINHTIRKMSDEG